MTDTVTASRRVSDRVLVQRVARGDESALGALYEKFANTLLSVAYRIVQDRSDAEEVVAETFAQSWREASRFSESRGSVAAWLTTICRSRSIDTLRARQRREAATQRAASTAEGVTVGTAGGPNPTDHRVEQSERRAIVQEAMAGLSHEQREAIELAYFGGRSHSEIAAELNQPLGTIKTRIRAGMQQLRDRLQSLFPDSTHE